MILCCGEALIDMIPITSEDGVPGFAPLPGGSVFNTAVAAGRLGATVGLVSGVSTDLFGAQLRAQLADSKVNTRMLIRSERLTTLAFVQLKDGDATYTFYDENSAGRILSPEDFPPVPDTVQALFFGGISLAMEPCGTAYEAYMLAQAGKQTLMLDPNVRPGFAADVEGYRARLKRMVAAADIVKVSAEDLEWLVPAAKNAEDAARTILEQGPTMVCLTMGSKGAKALMADGRSIEVPARPVTVADTVGAGDTFNAGVLTGLSAGGCLARGQLADAPDPVISAALRLGVRAASVTVARAGANPPWADELDETVG